MEDHHEKLKKEEIDRTKLSPTATELIAKYGNASTTIGGIFVLAGDFDYRDKAKKELEDYIIELEEKQRWVPVSERMPDNWESVLTIDISKSTRDVVSAFYNPETSLWSTPFSCDLWVTHCMPLPEPPIVYGKVCEE